MLQSPLLRSPQSLVQPKLPRGVLLGQPPYKAGAPPRLWRVGEKHINPDHEGEHQAVRWPPAAPLARTHGATKQRRFLLQEGFPPRLRSEEHTSELQSLMRISYAVFSLKQKTAHTTDQ